MTSETKLTAATIIRKEEASVARKADLLQSNAGPDDACDNTVFGEALGGVGKLVPPPFDIKLLRRLVRDSSSLPLCLEALTVNVATTGYNVLSTKSLAKDDGTPVSDETALGIRGFFDEMWPGLSLLDTLTKTVMETESVGAYYWEVLRNAGGEITFVRGVKSDYVRPVRLVSTDETTKVVRLKRNGKEVSIKNFKTYERRFAKVQKLGESGKSTPVYFKEFGASRDLDKTTGVWGTPAKPVDPKNLATELIQFKATDDMEPMWISDVASVLGEQEAMDLNLGFFDNGGIPPVIIALLGGQLTPDSSTRLNGVLSGKAKEKMSAVLVEVFSTGGSLDGKEVPANMQVFKFGAESQSDGMFSKYLAECAERIRRRWRLPALITGSASDMSYATAFVSYMVAEEQVFAPLRAQFYNVINNTLMKDKSLGHGEYKLQPKPLTVKDSKQMQLALDKAIDAKVIDRKEWLRQINSLLTLDMVLAPEPKTPEGTPPADGTDNSALTEDPAGADNSRTDVGSLNQQGTTGDAPRNSTKSEEGVDVMAILTMADKVSEVLMSSAPVTAAMVKKLEAITSTPAGAEVFRRALVGKVLKSSTGKGAEQLIGGTDGCCAS